MINKSSEKDAKELAQQFIELSLKMDTTLMVRMKSYADRLGVPLWLCIQNILISDFARKTARTMVKGLNPGRLLPEFSWEVLPDGTKKVITGESLFNSLVESYKGELEQPLRERKAEQFTTELNKFLKPGESGVTHEELIRRQDNAEFEKHIKNLPKEKQDKLRKAYSESGHIKVK